MDVFRHRHSVGTDVAIPALKETLRQRKTTPSDISANAIRSGVWNTLRPYLEAFTRRHRFRDSVAPGLETIEYPVLLDLPAPTLRAYAPETVVAEKFQAMVALGRVNSRMKDFYDVWMLSRIFSFDGERLARAIVATFARRQTAIPTEAPDALTSACADDPSKQRQWAAFAADLDSAPKELSAVIEDLSVFLVNAAALARSSAVP